MVRQQGQLPYSHDDQASFIVIRDLNDLLRTITAHNLRANVFPYLDISRHKLAQYLSCAQLFSGDVFFGYILWQHVH